MAAVRLAWPLLFLCIACGESGSEKPPAQHRPVTVPAAANELAALLVGEPNENELASHLERSLLNTHAAWRGAPCEASVPACTAAARAVASEFAARQATAMRQALIALYASRFSETISEPEMRDALEHLRSPAGGPLVRALRSALTVDSGNFRELMMTIGTAAELGDEGAIDAFYDRTKGLPRRVERVPPPPPPAPPSR